MKKTYCKPQISFEDFELCANIANGCDVTTGATKGTCGYTIPGIGTLFMSGVQACNWRVDDGYSRICYHIPLADTSLFTS